MAELVSDYEADLLGRGLDDRHVHDTIARLKRIVTETGWRALCDIPYGETTSYGELAQRIGNPKAVRAVGLANGSNPIAIIVPCHRVIGSNGSLTGYGGGLPTKKALLELERGQRRLL